MNIQLIGNNNYIKISVIIQYKCCINKENVYDYIKERYVYRLCVCGIVCACARLSLLCMWCWFMLLLYAPVLRPSTLPCVVLGPSLTQRWECLRRKWRQDEWRGWTPAVWMRAADLSLAECKQWPCPITSSLVVPYWIVFGWERGGGVTVDILINKGRSSLYNIAIGVPISRDKL